MSDETTPTASSDAPTNEPAAAAPSATPGRSHHPAWLVLIGVAASALVFFIGGAITHHGDHGRGKFGGHRGGMMDGRGDRGPGGRWGGPDGMRGGMDGRHSGMGGAGMMHDGPGMMGGPGGASAAASGTDPHTLMQNALKSLGVTDAELASALTKQVDKLEKAKKITAAQATAMRADIAEHHASTTTSQK